MSRVSRHWARVDQIVLECVNVKGGGCRDAGRYTELSFWGTGVPVEPAKTEFMRTAVGLKVVGRGQRRQSM